MKKNKGIRLSIYIQAVIAIMLIQLVHKIVREIPHVLDMGGIGAIAVPMFAGLLVLGIVLLFFNVKLRLILGRVTHKPTLSPKFTKELFFCLRTRNDIECFYKKLFYFCRKDF